MLKFHLVWGEGEGEGSQKTFSEENHGGGVNMWWREDPL